MRCLFAIAAVGAVALTSGFSRLHAQQEDMQLETNREYAIKAAYLYQFCRYVQWPSTAFPNHDSPFVLGVLGQAPFGESLEEIARTRRIDGRPVVIRQFASIAEYTPCHVLFVTASAGPGQAAAAIQKVKNAPVFLVGEEPGFAQQGGVANFFQEENRVRFEINTEVARQKHFVISSKLLSLGVVVGQRP